MNKVYVHFSSDGFSNGYIITSEDTHNAVIIDPGAVTEKMIHHIEGQNCVPQAILVTHNHTSHVAGIRTLRKIYNVPVYAAETEIDGVTTAAIYGDGFIDIPPYHIEYFSLPGHSPDCMIFKIGSLLFCGDTMSAGLIGSTPSQTSTKMLRNLLFSKVLSQSDDLFLFPGHGPPTTLNAERAFNIELQGAYNRKRNLNTYF